MGWDRRKKREEKNISGNSFPVSFKKISRLPKKMFLSNCLCSLKLPNPHSLTSSSGFDHLACQFITIAHILKPNKNLGHHIHFRLHKRAVRLNVSCDSGPSSMSFSPFLQNTSRTAWFMEGCILILSDWLPGYISLSRVQSIVFSVMKPTVMIFRKLICPSKEAIDSHPRT